MSDQDRFNAFMAGVNAVSDAELMALRCFTYNRITKTDTQFISLDFPNWELVKKCRCDDGQFIFHLDDEFDDVTKHFEFAFSESKLCLRCLGYGYFSALKNINDLFNNKLNFELENKLIEPTHEFIPLIYVPEEGYKYIFMYKRIRPKLKTVEVPSE